MKPLTIPNFRFSYCDHNGYDVAYNWKTFSTEIVNAICLKTHGGTYRQRHHFLMDGYKTTPTQPVALLIGDPTTRFIAACHEDGIEYSTAIKDLKDGKFPSFHFFPQSRLLEFGDHPIFMWKAPDHIQDFWSELDLGNAPQIIYKETKEFPELREIYKEDFELFESITHPKMISEKDRNIPSSIWEQMKGVSFAVKNLSPSNFNTTPPEDLANREATCRVCPEWEAPALNKIGRCKKCGCSTQSKLRSATERCPIGKWEAVNPSASEKQ